MSIAENQAQIARPGGSGHEDRKAWVVSELESFLYKAIDLRQIDLESMAPQRLLTELVTNRSYRLAICQDVLSRLTMRHRLGDERISFALRSPIGASVPSR